MRGIEVAYDCEAHIDYGSMYYQVYNDEALTNEFMQFVEQKQMFISFVVKKR